MAELVQDHNDGEQERVGEAEQVPEAQDRGDPQGRVSGEPAGAGRRRMAGFRLALFLEEPRGRTQRERRVEAGKEGLVRELLEHGEPRAVRGGRDRATGQVVIADAPGRLDRGKVTERLAPLGLIDLLMGGSS
jgi:hypothetical protein